MNTKNGKLVAIALAYVASNFSALVSAQESLSTCASEKTRQMELEKSIKLAPPPRIDPYTHRVYSDFDSIKAQDDVDRIDEWLWKNCREYSEEMRKIEQQYM